MKSTVFVCGRRPPHPRSIQRAEDLDLLRALGSVVDGGQGEGPDDGGLTAEEVVAFEDMRQFLGRRPEATLSKAQREWAERRAGDLGLSWGDPARRNANVPRGREVETPAVLRDLPKRPPGRRSP